MQRRAKKAAIDKTVPKQARVVAMTPRDELNNRLIFRLFQTANLYQSSTPRELDVTAVQGVLLGALYRDVDRGMSFSDLCGYLAVSRQNLDAVLKRLEGIGLVKRVENEADRRVKIVRLTRGGVAAWLDLHARSLDFFRNITATLSAAEVEACADALAKIGRALKASRKA
ncbi:MarR family winged helix-turn-helix transcriptional regulator [Bradyrhizobium sp. AS23.2]|uniref:MarR family winged helix-turn-helix transcriptional regulator n=1 Tax=Bradyrhizobium sp. AS23.2 TaxID=1680155 RepID=UPI0009FB77D7|nr:MarR family winged helix-turn-helix transcriptional regulator [Bradyrhizobium sp. AS23.2]